MTEKLSKGDREQWWQERYDAKCADIERLKQEWADEYKVHKQAAKAAEDSLATATALLPTAEQLRADKRISIEAKRRLADLVDSLANQPAAPTRTEVEDLRALLTRWFQFDFDCPEEEYDEEDDTYEEDGTALARLYDDTAAVLVKKTEDPSAPEPYCCNADCDTCPYKK